jgi:hypothetical protein
MTDPSRSVCEPPTGTNAADGCTVMGGCVGVGVGEGGTPDGATGSGGVTPGEGSGVASGGGLVTTGAGGLTCARSVPKHARRQAATTVAPQSDARFTP